MNRYEMWERHCVDIQPIIRQMGRAGLRIDRDAQEQFQEQLRTEYQAEYVKLQHEVPQAARDVQVYKRLTPQLTEFQDWIPDESSGGKKLKAFNPHSYVQVARLAKLLGVKLPKMDKADEDSDSSTEAKYLLRASKKAPIFKTVMFCRVHRTMLSRYMWQLDRDNRVYTQIGFNPSTWRFSSKNVNLFNIPKRTDLAKAFRRLIVASPGTLLIEGDSSAIEAVLVGYFAGSQEVVQLAKAGIHDWLAAKALGQEIPLNLPDGELSRRCHAIKQQHPAEHDRYKRVVYLSSYLGTPQRIWEEYPEEFETQREAKELQEFFFATEPGQAIRRWQQRTLEEAHREVTLTNPWGYRHSFYSVMQWDRRSGKMRLGDDAKRAVAFRPQSTAAAIQREILLSLVERLPDCLPWLRLPIYDSIVMEVPEIFAVQVARVLGEVMVQPWQRLGGLEIGAEVKLGSNLAEMEAV